MIEIILWIFPFGQDDKKDASRDSGSVAGMPIVFCVSGETIYTVLAPSPMPDMPLPPRPSGTFRPIEAK